MSPRTSCFAESCFQRARRAFHAYRDVIQKDQVRHKTTSSEGSCSASACRPSVRRPLHEISSRLSEIISSLAKSSTSLDVGTRFLCQAVATRAGPVVQTGSPGGQSRRLRKGRRFNRSSKGAIASLRSVKPRTWCGPRPVSVVYGGSADHQRFSNLGGLVALKSLSGFREGLTDGQKREYYSDETGRDARKRRDLQ